MLLFDVFFTSTLLSHCVNLFSSFLVGFFPSVRFGFFFPVCMSFGFLPCCLLWLRFQAMVLLVLLLVLAAAAWFLFYQLKRLRMLLLRRTIRREMMMNRKKCQRRSAYQCIYMRIMLAYKIGFNVLVPLMVHERFIFLLCITISIVFIVAAARAFACVVKSESYTNI